MSAAAHQVAAYWSMQSPYCYFALDRLLELDARDDVRVDVRPVRPGVLRVPERFRDRDTLEQHYFEHDTRRTAAFLGLPYGEADPPPVAFETSVWVARADQPLIGMLYDLLLAAASLGQALVFLDRVMRLIWDGRTPGWDQGGHLDAAIAAAGLDRAELAEIARRDHDALAQRLATKEAAMLEAGHWGVPLFVLAGEQFYGQDRVDQLIWRLEGNA